MAVITAQGLGKEYDGKPAVSDLSFEVHPGSVTGFLGPNGAGKSTTMRMLLGLDRCDAGSLSFDQKRLVDFEHPPRSVGALLDASYVHPTRKARDHLWAIAASDGIGRERVDEVLELVGLSQVAAKRVGGYSLGMKQRLGLAGAMLGDPHTLLFDEPANGLDPEGIQWMRLFLQRLAAEGRTVFVSSHLLSEMALVAQDLVVIGRGRLIYQGTVGDFMASAARTWVRVRSPQVAAIAATLTGQGAEVVRVDESAIDVVGPDATYIGELAAREGAVLHELSPQTASLEEAFLQVTAASQEYQGTTPPPRPGGAPPPPPPGNAPPPAAPPPP
ncbi:MAG: ATP-binding cassette domain-containing protein, partial [Nocardioidaceae bacterium]